MKNIPFSPPDVGEEEIAAVADALRSGWITTGPKTKEFENRIAEYCNADRAVCLNSATACLETVLRLLKVGPGDEVITSAYTYTASASPAYHVGAKIVLVDTLEDSLEMDPVKLEAAITENTKVIVPVDLAGIMCDYSRYFEIAERKKNLFKANPESEIQKALGRVAVVSDSAHAFGADRNGEMSGSVADFSTFSFHAVKNLTTAEGGALTWKTFPGVSDDDIYRDAMLISLHGQSKDALSKMKPGAWEYDIVSPAYKCNMTDIMAAIGLVQLDRYPGMLSRRRETIERYDEALHPIGVETLCHYSENHNSSGHLYITRIPGISVDKRNEIIVKMAEAGIATNVHYKPLPMFTAYKALGFDISDYPNAYAHYENEITLPLNTLLTDEDVERVIKTYTEIIESETR